jgi:hypothetical protein
MPTVFQCGEDQSDLTQLVQEELEAQIPAAFNVKRPKKFRVVVSCSGGEKPHDVACSGQIIS